MSRGQTTRPDHSASMDEAAITALLRQREPGWTAAEQQRLDARLACDAEFARAFAHATAVWSGIEGQATTPDVMRIRHAALARARCSQAAHSRSRRRAAIAVVAMVVLAVGIGVQLSPYGHHPGSYRTDIAEQRVIPLEDTSSIALDAATSLRVQYSDDARSVQLLDGQAQFSVAPDPARPFKVHVGDLTVVALGTVFTVEHVDGRTRVTLIEGRVAVVPESPRARPLGLHLRQPARRTAAFDASPVMSRTMELAVGEELRLDREGHATVAKVNLESASAWRQGKLVFHDLRLDEAVSRMNRHSHLQIAMDDPELAALPVSGVFKAGDATAFAQALESYLPLSADYSRAGRVSLHRDKSR